MIGLAILLAMGALAVYDYYLFTTGQTTITQYVAAFRENNAHKPHLFVLAGAAVGLLVGLVLGFILGHLFWP